MGYCKYCLAIYPSDRAVRIHQGKTPDCLKRRNQDLQNLVRNAVKRRTETEPAVPEMEIGIQSNGIEIPTDNDDQDPYQNVSDSGYGSWAGNSSNTDEDENVPGIPPHNEGEDAPDTDASRPRGVLLEEVEDEEDFLRRIHRVAYPIESGAGQTYGPGKTLFESIHDEQVLHGGTILGPFENDEEWELAKWLIKNVGHNQADAFLKLPIIQRRVDPEYKNKDQLLERIDSLPGGVAWHLEEVTLTGDLRDEDGNLRKEKLELWWRDPIECIQELMGNPMFCDVMKFAPELEFEDMANTKRVINEMWTADWWWRLQQRLPAGATITPVILSSDKTKLSQFRGDQSAWPVYLTIGNIAKDVRREASSHATVLIGYLPVGKFDCYSDAARQAARYRLFHHCMRIIVKSMVEKGKTGVDMICSDGQVRWIWPIFAAYVADYPEQCLIAACMENRCPECKVDPKKRGDHVPCQMRNIPETLNLLNKHRTGCKDEDFKNAYKDLGLRAVYRPFWADLPFSNVFCSFTPDLLHQLHKGVFKDHLVKWCTNILGKDELDARFKSMSPFPGLKHFKIGISKVSQWTGHEHKAMEKVFVGLLSGATDGRVVEAARSIIDFIFYSSLHTHTTDTLEALERSLTRFHELKNVFIELEARFPEHFNIPKIHSMEHYGFLIKLFGSADGYNTESPERLHIDYAKNAYRASNKRDYVIQMTNWLRRQENADRFTAYLAWCRGQVPRRRSPGSEGIALAEADDDGVEEGEVRTVPSSSTATTGPTFTVAKRPAASHRSIPANKIIEEHNASRFLPAIHSFISTYGSTVIPRGFDEFNLYTKLTVTLPEIPFAGRKDLKNIIRAKPPIPARFRRAAQPAQLDFALIRTGEKNDKTDGTALHGLRIAHIRVIFELPVVYQVSSKHPLAYVEWCTPFSTPDPITGLYTVKPSTRNHQPYGEVIELDRIVRNIHLQPKFGRKKDPRWSSANVTERCPAFHPNPYSDLHNFALFRIGKRIYR